MPYASFILWPSIRGSSGHGGLQGTASNPDVLMLVTVPHDTVPMSTSVRHDCFCYLADWSVEGPGFCFDYFICQWESEKRTSTGLCRTEGWRIIILLK